MGYTVYRSTISFRHMDYEKPEVPGLDEHRPEIRRDKRDQHRPDRPPQPFQDKVYDEIITDDIKRPRKDPENNVH